MKFSYFQSYGVKDPRYQAFLTEVRSDTLKYWDNYYPISCPTARLSEKTSWTLVIQPDPIICMISLKRWNKLKLAAKGRLLNHLVLSQRRNFYTHKEFCKKRVIAWKVSTVLNLNKFQYHMTGQVDDYTQLFMQDLEHHNHLKKICWSKNAFKERDAPWRVVLGSTETTLCVLVPLVL